MILRKKCTGGFTTMHNEVIQDKKLSFKAKGVLLYLISRPDNWEFYESDISNQSTDGKDAVRTALMELIREGFLERKRIKKADGTFSGWEYLVSETRTDMGKTDMGKSAIGKSATNNTDITNTDINTTNVVFGKPAINELFAYWEKTTGLPISAKQQQNRFACQNLLKRHGEDGLHRLIDGVALTHGDKYAPRIADFSQLQAKLGELLLWGKKYTSRKGTIKV